MDFSFNVIQRIAFREGGKERFKNRLFMDDVRALTDQELIDKLKSYGVDMNRALFHELIQNFLSAEEIFFHYFNQPDVKVEEPNDEDWLWMSLAVLWERWEPGKPSFEMIDNEMQKGYDLLKAEEVEKACELWLRLWDQVLKIMKEKNYLHLNDFDEKFRGTQIVENWIYDLEMELANAGRIDPKFFEDRITFTGNFLKQFPGEDFDLLRVMKRALAESYNHIGNSKETEFLFEKWLEDDETWGWGWIGYSDCFWLDSKEHPDYDKAERILKRALDIPDVEDREHIVERLTDLYDETNRPEEAEKLNMREEEPEAIKKVKMVIPSGKKGKKKKY